MYRLKITFVLVNFDFAILVAQMRRIVSANTIKREEKARKVKAKGVKLRELYQICSFDTAP